MHYSLNISRHGSHIFTTSSNSAVSEKKAKALHTLFMEKFPEAEGYKVDVSLWSTSGKDVQF